MEESKFYDYIDNIESSYLQLRGQSSSNLEFINDEYSDISDRGDEEGNDEFLYLINSARECFQKEHYRDAMDQLQRGERFIKGKKADGKLDRLAVVESLSPDLKMAKSIVTTLHYSKNK